MNNLPICLVLGNGPSMARVFDNHYNLLTRKYFTFGSNRVYLRYAPDFYACVNPYMASQSRDEIAKMTRTVKFVTDSVPIDGCTPLHSIASDFSVDPLREVWECGSVTIVLLQLVYYFGFRKVGLLGIDHDYPVTGGPANTNIFWTGMDVNHFSAGYMKEGEKWDCPDLYSMERGYERCKEVFERAGGSIVNYTPGTKLSVFPLGDIEEL